MQHSVQLFSIKPDKEDNSKPSKLLQLHYHDPFNKQYLPNYKLSIEEIPDINNVLLANKPLSQIQDVALTESQHLRTKTLIG